MDRYPDTGRIRVTVWQPASTEENENETGNSSIEKSYLMLLLHVSSGLDNFDNSAYAESY